MLTVLTGDKVSSGDLIIVDRGLKLLRHFCPGEEILKLDRWKPIDEHLDRVNQSRALILMGGPAFEENVYPGIYPLVADLKRIKTPIVAMGLGSYLVPFNETAVSMFTFSRSSRPLLQRLMEDSSAIGVRDYITRRLLVANSIDKVEVIGCPAWFNLETLGKPVAAPTVESVGFAPGVLHMYHKSRAAFSQQVEVMTLLRDLFPDAAKYCVFQDSLEKDDYKDEHSRRTQRSMADEAERLGYEIVDCTYNLANMVGTYEKTDLLVGYRVHSHICMLSMGKPSVLISEDSRGYGMNDFIGLRNFNALVDENGPLDRLYQGKLGGRLMRRVYPREANLHLTKQLRVYLDQELDSGFARYAGVQQVILHYFERMEAFIKGLPCWSGGISSVLPANGRNEEAAPMVGGPA